MKFFDHIPSVQGFDTETYKGEIKVICTPTEYLEPGRSEDLIEWLYKKGEDYNFFYNIKFDFSVILKPYLNAETKDAARSGKDIRIGNYRLDYVTDKNFTITPTNTKKRPTKHYFDIAQFYRAVHKRYTLDRVGFLYLGERKNAEELGIEAKKIGEVKGYYEENREDVIKYCQRDAYITMKLGVLLRDSIKKRFGVYPKVLNSQASIAKTYLQIHHESEAYAFWDIINDLNEDQKISAFNTVFQCFRGGIFYIYILGKSVGVREVDINSAYPNAIRKLKSVIGQRLAYVREYTPADYGFYIVEMVLDGSYPIPFRIKDNEIIYPITIKPVRIYLTGIEVEFFRSRGMDVKVVEGWIIDGNDFEFKDYEALYMERKRMKNVAKSERDPSFIESEQLKTVMNSTYGTFGQSKYGFTKWSNFIYASYITASARLKIYSQLDILRENGCRPISIMTDAIAYIGPYRVDSDLLGEFKTEILGNKASKTEEAIIRLYMSGLYSVNGVPMRTRSYEHIEARSLIHAKGHKLTVKVKRSLGVKEAIIQDRIDEIGDLKETSKNIDLESNLWRYDCTRENLTFEYLRDNAMSTSPQLLDDDKIWQRNYDKNSFRRLLKTAAKRDKSKSVVLPESTTEEKLPEHKKMFNKFLHAIASDRYSRALQKYRSDPRKMALIDLAVSELEQDADDYDIELV